MSELYIFARFHAREGCEDQVEQVLHAVLEPSRAELGCLAIHAFRSTRDSRLFHIHSRWRNEAAFEHHATLPHTALFVERMEKLIDHPFDVTRSNLIG
jgi:quinol monooxygenase YgiN